MQRDPVCRQLGRCVCGLDQLRADRDRLDWLEQQAQYGYALVEDDFGNWAVVADGIQTHGEAPGDDEWFTSYLNTPDTKWEPSARLAIDAARAAD